MATWVTYLAGIHTKSGKRQSILINATARAVLIHRARFRAEHCPATAHVFCDARGQRIGNVQRSFVSACSAAGIVDFHIHDLRRTCGSWLVQARTPIQEVARLLRHSDIQVTMSVYAHLMPDQLQQTVQILDRHNLVIAPEARAMKTSVTD